MAQLPGRGLASPSSPDPGRLVLVVGTGYLLGSLPIGLWVGRLSAGVDVRKFGSRVSGATNVLRAAGPAAAASTLALDATKGYLAVKLSERLGAGEEGSVLAAAAAATGHSWPVFAEFRGGRSVITCWGSLLALDGPAASSAAIAGSLTVASTRYVSAGALTGVGAAVAASLLRWPGRSPRSLVFSSFALGLLAFRLRGNIGRLRRGEELRLGDHVNLAREGPAAPRRG